MTKKINKKTSKLKKITKVYKLIRRLIEIFSKTNNFIDNILFITFLSSSNHQLLLSKLKVNSWVKLWQTDFFLNDNQLFVHVPIINYIKLKIIREASNQRSGLDSYFCVYINSLIIAIISCLRIIIAVKYVCK